MRVLVWRQFDNRTIDILVLQIQIDRDFSRNLLHDFSLFEWIKEVIGLSPFTALKCTFMHIKIFPFAEGRINVNILQTFLAKLVFSLFLAAYAFGSVAQSLTEPADLPCNESIDSTAISASKEIDQLNLENKYIESESAKARGEFEHSFKVLLAAYCNAQTNTLPPKALIELSARTAESALDINLVKIAEDILANTNRNFIASTGPMGREDLALGLANARLLSFQDKNSEALKIRQDLQQNVEGVFGDKSDSAIENRIRIVNLQLELGQTEKALEEAKIIHDMTSIADDKSLNLKFLSINAYASALTLSGRESESLIALERFRATFLNGSNSQDLRSLEINESISETLTRLGKYEEALVIESQVFLNRIARNSNVDQDALRTVWHIGSLYLETGRTEAARAISSYLQRTIEIRKSTIPGSFQLYVASLAANIDSLGNDSARTLEKRRKVYEQALEIYGPNAVDTQVELANLGVALRRDGKINSGCETIAKVAATIANDRPEDTWSLEFARLEGAICAASQLSPSPNDPLFLAMRNSITVIGEHNDPTSKDYLNALGLYANAVLKFGDRGEAKNLLEEFVSRVEISRVAQAEGSVTRLSSFSDWVSGSSRGENPIASYRQLALMHAQDAELESALRVSELARDRALGDRYLEQDWRRRWLPDAERRQLEAVLDRIQGLDEEISLGTDIVEQIRKESLRTLAVAERGRIERDIRARLHVPEIAVRPPTLDTLREHLKADTALVSVLHSGDDWWALVIRRDAPARFVPFADRDLGINAAAWLARVRGDPVRAWVMPDGRLIVQDARPQGAAGSYLSLDELGQRLSRALVLPLAQAAGDARQLVFVGDDELVGLPLAALPLGTGLVVDRYDISYAPSLASYDRWQGPHPRSLHRQDLLAIGGIDYSSAPAGPGPVGTALRFAAEHPLPYAQQEVLGIARLFAGGRARVLGGDQATKAGLQQLSRTQSLAQYRYVHFATHAWARGEQPGASAIALGGTAQEPAVQWVLTAAELAGLQMGSELLTLSACDTGVGRYAHGQGLLGLAYASLAAGNRSALLSLWAIADDTTARFMEHLYQRLGRGMGPVAALAATQREFLHSADPRLADPLVWAPFVIYGGH